MPRPVPRRSGAAPRAALAILLLAGCASPPSAPADCDAAASARTDESVQRRADNDRMRLLEREYERVKTDLAEAELALVNVESGLRSTHTRADAVAEVAAARIQLERARDQAPWQAAGLDEAAAKLDEAERQIEANHLAAAIFFASRSNRIADRALEEARIARNEPGVKAVRGGRVNLRKGPGQDEEVLAVLVAGTPIFPERNEGEWVLVRTPAGLAGWLHGSLIR